MNQHCKRIACILALMGAMPQLAPAQQVPVSLPFSRQYEFTSQINHRSYRIMVALPVGYGDLGDTNHYPVLYLLDANDQLPMAADMARYLAMAAGRTAEIPGLIIVGVGYPVDRYGLTRVQRSEDYTTTHVGNDAQGNPPIPGIEANTGGAPALLRVIRTEIAPRIEGEFRTTTDRGIMGHSLGGLFAAYALIAAPDYFTRYAILSPSLWWDNSEIFTHDSAFAAGRKSFPKRVFLANGGLEGKIGMIDPMLRFTKMLEAHHFEGLQIENQIFDDETHLTVIPFAIARALRVLYYSP